MAPRFSEMIAILDRLTGSKEARQLGRQMGLDLAAKSIARAQASKLP